MKCKDCECCHLVSRRRWNSEIYAFQDIPVYECWGVKESFEITDINRECTEYPEKRAKKIGCEYCEDHKDSNIVCFQCQLPDALILKLDTTPIPLNFCPNCGRKLKEDKKNA